MMRTTLPARLLVALGAFLGLAGCASTGDTEAVLDFYEWLEIRQIAYNAELRNGNIDRILQQDRLISANSERHVGVLMRDTNDKRTDRQLMAIFGLSFVRTAEARDRLIMLLDEDQPLVRAQAAAGLGLQGRETTPVQPLTDLLKDRDHRVRMGALFGLRGILRKGRDRGALPAILAAVEDTSPSVRSESMTVLAQLAMPSTIPVLVEKGLLDRFKVTRENAAIALREMGSEAYEAIPYLIEALRDHETTVVGAAYSALRNITSVRLNPQYHTWRDWYNEEKRLYAYTCPRHRHLIHNRPGKCPECGADLERVLSETTEGASEDIPPGHFVCPNHAQVEGSVEFICPKCGERTIPKKDVPDKEEPGNGEPGPGDPGKDDP